MALTNDDKIWIVGRLEDLEAKLLKAFHPRRQRDTIHDLEVVCDRIQDLEVDLEAIADRIKYRIKALEEETE